MLGVGLATVWFAAIAVALIGCAVIERRSRLSPGRDRPELALRRALWGGGLLVPPSYSITVRGLAGGARIVRARTVVSERAKAENFP